MKSLKQICEGLGLKEFEAHQDFEMNLKSYNGYIDDYYFVFTQQPIGEYSWMSKPIENVFIQCRKEGMSVVVLTSIKAMNDVFEKDLIQCCISTYKAKFYPNHLN